MHVWERFLDEITIEKICDELVGKVEWSIRWLNKKYAEKSWSNSDLQHLAFDFICNTTLDISIASSITKLSHGKALRALDFKDPDAASSLFRSPDRLLMLFLIRPQVERQIPKQIEIYFEIIE